MSNQIVITIEIAAPDKKGARQLIASAARAGEIPLIAVGNFADRHAILDRLWVELAKRPAMVVVPLTATDNSAIAPIVDDLTAAATAEPTATAESQTAADETDGDEIDGDETAE